MRGAEEERFEYSRWQYIAAVAAYPGGWASPIAALGNNVPAIMAVHGKLGLDVVVVDYEVTSFNWEQDIKTRGRLAIDCDHGGGHLIPSAAVPSVLSEPGMASISNFRTMQ